MCKYKIKAKKKILFRVNLILTYIMSIRLSILITLIYMMNDTKKVWIAFSYLS